jgi:hypothetical protein
MANPQTNPTSVGDLLKTIGPFFAGCVALLIALFHEDYKRWRSKPKLHAFINTDPPCCVRVEHMQILEGSLQRPHYALRLRIMNSGNAQARDVEVYAKNLQRKNGHGKFESVANFDGIYLVSLDTLNPKMPKYRDLARVFCKDHLPTSVYSHLSPPAEDYLGNRTVIDLAPPVGGWGQVFGPGIYRLTIVLGAANASPIEKALEIKVTGTWPGVEPQKVSQILDAKML